MRRKLLILILLAGFIPAFAQSYSDTIGTEYDSTPWCVLPGSYGFNLSATLYSATEINHPAGDISALSYHISYGNYYDWEGHRVKIYVMETNDTVLDLSKTWQQLTSAATLVYDSTSFDFVWYDDYWRSFEFNQSVEYHGGNLLVLTEGYASELVPGTGDGIYMYYHWGTAANFWNCFQDNDSLSFTTQLSALQGDEGGHDYRPDIFFTFAPEPSCMVSVPYTENFDAYDSFSDDFPDCWTQIDGYDGITYALPNISPMGYNDSDGCLFFFIEAGAYEEYAVTPMIDTTLSMQDLSLSFQYKSRETNLIRLVVGVMTDPNDASTFIGVDTVHASVSQQWEEMQVNLASYTGNGHYIALMLSGIVSSYSYPSCFVDDLTIFTTPSCTPPTNIHASVSADTAVISWFATNNTSAVRLYYREQGATSYDSVDVMDETSYMLTGLAAGTVYEYYMMTLCDEEYSTSSAVFTFSIPCDAITEFPWIEDFENGLTCWTSMSSTVGQDWILETEGSDPDCQPVSGSYLISFNAWDFLPGSWSAICSPMIDLTEARHLSLKFYRYGPQSSYNGTPYNDRMEVYVSETPSLNNATLLATVTGYASQELWDSISVNIPMQNSGNAYLLLKGISDYGYNLHVDDVVISEHAVIEDVTFFIDTAICEGDVYEFYDQMLSVEGTYTYTIVGGEAEADTVVTLNLQINPVYSETYHANIPSGTSYIEHGFNVSEAGTYTQVLTSTHGCDSTIILILTVSNDVQITLDEAICEGDVYEFYDQTLAESGTYTHTIETADVADTIVTLNLTVNPVYNISIVDSIHEGETYTEHGFNVSEAGTYAQELTTVNGCDSLITLVLTVMPEVSVNLYGIEVMMYPNPAHEYANIVFGDLQESATVFVADMQGRVIRKYKLGQDQSHLIIYREGLAAGPYFVRLQTTQGHQIMKLLFD